VVKKLSSTFLLRNLGSKKRPFPVFPAISYMEQAQEYYSLFHRTIIIALSNLGWFPLVTLRVGIILWFPTIALVVTVPNAMGAWGPGPAPPTRMYLIPPAHKLLVDHEAQKG
jgi:hypothetical protein